jgi:hypothetical protein
VIAGTLAKLRDPVDELLGSATADGGLPALEVEESQETLDGRIVQSGVAADTVLEPCEDVSVTDRDGDVSINTEHDEHRVETTSEWIADVQNSGLLCAASARGDGDFAFPFGLLGARTSGRPERLEVDVRALKDRWEAEDAIRETTMVGDGGEDATSLKYGPAAHSGDRASLGLGFEVETDFDIIEGVVWRSGYVACYDVDLTERFVGFVLEEIWPHCYVPEDDDVDSEQQTLGEATEPEEDLRECIRCGATEENVTIVELLDEDVCLTCNDAWQEDRWSLEEVKDGAE